jgi:hypothetical protein
MPAQSALILLAFAGGFRRYVAGSDAIGRATGHKSVRESVRAGTKRRIVNLKAERFSFRAYGKGDPRWREVETSGLVPQYD